MNQYSGLSHTLVTVLKMPSLSRCTSSAFYTVNAMTSNYERDLCRSKDHVFSFIRRQNKMNIINESPERSMLKLAPFSCISLSTYQQTILKENCFHVYALPFNSFLFLIFREHYGDENNVVIFFKYEFWRCSRLVWLLGSGKILHILLVPECL